MMSRRALLDDPDRLLVPAEVAFLFRVDPRTVSRWHKAGRMKDVRIIKTPGGHRRFRAEDIKTLLDGNTDETEMDQAAAS
jgi:predicted site-specific integrase-resolvase